MYHSAPLLFSLVASALAYTVTQPSASQPWSMSGPQTLSWDRVSTDPSTFAVVLTDMSDSNYQQVLAAEVPGDLQSIMLNPPSGGWPQGEGFRLNLVKDVNHVNTIFAQSSEYGIGVSNTPSGSALTQTATSPTTSAVRSTSQLSTFITSTFTSSDVLPVTTTTSSRSVAILPASSSAITTSASRVATPTSAATSSTTAVNSGSKTLAVHVGSVPLLVAFSYFFM